MKRILFFLLILTIYAGCSKSKGDANQSINCAELKQTMINDDVASVKELINEIAATINAPIGLNEFDTYKFLIDELVKRIKTNCAITVEVFCYGCIDTLPPQTEIRLKFITGLTSIEKTLDLIVTDDNKVRCLNMHD